MAKTKLTAKEKKDSKEFFEALKMLEEERGVPKEFIAQRMADAIIVAARKDYGNDTVSCIIDTEKEIFTVVARKTIVDTVEDPFSQISKEDAAAIDPKSLDDGFIDIKLDPKKFGRIIAQNSKNNL